MWRPRVYTARNKKETKRKVNVKGIVNGCSCWIYGSLVLRFTHVLPELSYVHEWKSGGGGGGHVPPWKMGDISNVPPPWFGGCMIHWNEDPFFIHVSFVRRAFLHFHLLLENALLDFNQTWQESSLGVGDSKLFK